MRIIFLHLSDIHFTSNPQDNSILRKKENIVLAVLNEIFNINPEIIFLIVSGDIAFSGNNDEYRIAIDFLSYIKGELEEKAKKSVISIFVPGNHDCNFRDHDQTRTFLLDKISHDETVEKLDDKLIENCLIVQNDYNSFVENMKSQCNYKCNELFLHKLLSISEYCLKEFRITFKCFNTSWDSMQKEEGGKKIFPIELFEYKLPKYESDLVVGIMHHPYNWFKPDNSRQIREILEKRADMLLTGHEHDPAISTKIDVRDYYTEYVEGAVLQDSHDYHKSGFNILAFDLEKRLNKYYQYQWNDGSYLIAQESEWREYKRNRNLEKRFIKFSPEFTKFLNDPGIQINHPYKDEVTIGDLFEFPDVEPLNLDTANKSDIDVDPISSEYLLDFDRFTNKISISGEEGSGKTTLCKIYVYKLREMGLIPVYVDGNEIKSPMVYSFFALLNDKYKWQYLEENFVSVKSIPNDKHVLIIDNLDKTKLNVKSQLRLISEIVKVYKNIIITKEHSYSIEEMLTESKSEETTIAAFSEFGILEFGHHRRMKLIEKWNSLGREHTISTSALISQCEKIIKALDTIIGRNFIPTYPIFLISILHILEAKEAHDFREGSYGFYYQYLLTSSLNNRVPREELETYINYLSELANYMLSNDLTEISKDELRKFHYQYCKEYAVNLNIGDIVDNLLLTKTISRNNSDYKFRYKYIYYYSVAKYFSNNIHNSTIKDKIKVMCSKLHLQEYANIILFLTHHSKDPFILENIYEVAENLFKDFKPLSMGEDIASINQLIKEVPLIALEDRNVKEYRDEHYQKKDKAARRINSKRDKNAHGETDDQSDIGAVANSAFKTIQIIGQILKNHYGSIKGEDKELLATEAYLIGLRFLNAFVSMVEENLDILIKIADSYIASKKEEEKERDQLQGEVKLILYKFYRVIFFAMIKKLSQSIGHEKLRETFKSIGTQYDMTSIQLINMSIKLDHYDEDNISGMPIREIRDMATKVQKNKLAYDLLRELILRHTYMYPTKIEDKQSIREIFKISVKSQRVLYDSSKQKKRNKRSKKNNKQEKKI